jgi:hypothetical protein
MMDNIGEIRERNYRRKKLLILGVCAMLSGLGPIVMKVAGNENVIFPLNLGPGWDLSLVTRVAVFVVFFAILSLVVRWKWVASDEVRRSHMLSFWAAIGWSLPATFVVFMMFGRDIPEADRLQVAFFAPITMGLLFSIARWLRDGFVW